jgi:pimeloyl-ACP methyl ester carboxylesterase
MALTKTLFSEFFSINPSIAYIRLTFPKRDSSAFKELKVLRQSEKLPLKEALNHFLTILEKADLRDRLSSVICPVQLICENQNYIYPKEIIRWIQEHMLNARLNFIQGCNHLPFLTKIQITNDTLENFLIN